MGLTLHYELRLPATTSDEDVTATLSGMRTFAETLSFAEVTTLNVQPADGGWLALWANLIARPHEDEAVPMTGDAGTARGFLVNAGNGCESAVLGFLRRADATGTRQEWYWYSFCKTQYASVVSEAHFLTCHKSLVALLEHAATLGVEVIVRDDGRYWDTRDESLLVEEVRKMNRLVARIAGTLSDAMGPSHEVDAAIFDHREFERLEMGE